MRAALETLLLVLVLFVAVVAIGDWLRQDAQHVPKWEQDEQHTPNIAGDARSNDWPAVRAKHIARHPVCEACGSSDGLNVHHIKPFHSRPDLELEPTNLITLCRKHHFEIGHDPDGAGPMRANWYKANPNVVNDAKRMRAGK